MLTATKQCVDGSTAVAVYSRRPCGALRRFGIAVAIVDGHVYEVGDSRHTFTIQSVSKAFTFGVALGDHGREVLLHRVGVEPTGDPINAIVLDEVANRPRNPMVNTGAIAVTGLINGADPSERSHRIIDALSRFAGRPLTVDETVALSETETGHRNRAIAHLMRGFDMLRPEVDGVLDLYFRQCAVLVNAVDLAVMGATMALLSNAPRSAGYARNPTFGPSNSHRRDCPSSPNVVRLARSPCCATSR